MAACCYTACKSWPEIIYYSIYHSFPPDPQCGIAPLIWISTQFILGREGVITAVSGEWELVELELDDGERVSVPVASVDIKLAATSTQPGANRRLTATLGVLAAIAPS